MTGYAVTRFPAGRAVSSVEAAGSRGRWVAPAVPRRNTFEPIFEESAEELRNAADAPAAAAVAIAGAGDQVLSNIRTPFDERTCTNCGCTDEDCSGCIERTGVPCYWVAYDLCSACVHLVEASA